MDFLLNPTTWLDLLILTVLEVVLGIDNIVFIVLASNRLPVAHQKFARRVGLSLAMVMRLLLLTLIFWLDQLTNPLFFMGSLSFSIRNLIELVGGLYLVYKAYSELREYFHEPQHTAMNNTASDVWLVILQIMLLDMVFSLDSVITAVAIAYHYIVMAAAIVLAVIAMLFASEGLSSLIKKYKKLKLLALLLILLVGVMLIIKGFNVDVAEWLLYIVIAGLSIIILPPWKAWLLSK